MSSFEDQFYLENPTRWQTLKRDLRLLCMLGLYALMWLTRGVLVRRAYKRAQAQGAVLELDTLIED
jgi:hypothetical protein